jgi:hypothetical protein
MVSGQISMEEPPLEFATVLKHCRPRQGVGPAIGNVISIGNHCMAAEILRRFGLRKFSGPFDWIFSTPAMTAHCLSDDFSTLLDPSHFEPVPLDGRRHGPEFNVCHHRFYRDGFGVRFVFNHHDMTQLENAEYFARCVSRFRDAVKTPPDGTATILFHIDILNRMLDTEFRAMSEAVDAYSGRNACVVSVSVAQDRAEIIPEIRRIAGGADGHARYILRPTSDFHPLSFIDPINDLALARLLYARGAAGPEPD